MSLTVIGESETNERKKNEEENFILFSSSVLLLFFVSLTNQSNAGKLLS
jgi:hypothetical protein